jgi:hypothetical protein
MQRHKKAASSKRDVPPSTDMVRIQIDRGLDGDKIDHPDPATAPLGTDAEAAGATPTQEERAMAARRPKTAAHEAVSSPPDGGAVSSWKTALIIFAFALIAGALLVSLRLHQSG